MAEYMTPQRRAFEYYRIFLSVRLHFTQDGYDMKKTHGTVSGCTMEKFKGSRSYGVFMQLSKRHPVMSGYTEFIVANILNDSSIYPVFLLSDDAKDIYNKWVSRVDSLYYTVRDEINRVTSIPPKRFFSANGGDLPVMVKKCIDGTLSLETVVVLYRFLKLKKRWEGILENNFLYQDFYMKVRKYSRLLDYDIFKMKKVVSGCLGKWLDCQQQQ